MPVTGVRGRQILDGGILRADINTASSGDALITKILVGAGLVIQSSTGVDSGTGDVTLALGASGVTAGSYGSSSLVPVITVDAYGRITSISTAAGSGGMTNPMSTIGDIIYGDTAGTPARLAAGTVGQALVSNGAAAPVWATLTLENLPDAWVKRAVKVATTANITLSGTQTIDGIAVVIGDRVLVKNQTTTSQNGIYIVSAGAWTRATDSDTSTKIAGGTVAVDQGTTNGGTSWDTDFRSTDTIGTTAMTWFRLVDTGYTIPVSQGGTGAVTLTGVMIGNGTAAVTAVAGSGSQLLRRNAGNTGYEFFTHDFASTAGATFSGQIISSRAWNAGAGLGQIYLNGNTGNRIDFNGNGFAAPTLTTISTGTKIILYPAITASTVDYALGVDASTLWFSVPSTSASFKFYGATTVGATLTGAGALTLSSTLSAAGTITSTQANGFTIGGLVNAARIQYGSDAATSFSLLTAANGYAGLYASSGIFSTTVTAAGGTMNGTLNMIGTLLFANASSPNTHTIQFGDNTGWVLRFMTNVSGTPTARFSFTDGGTLTATGQFITTRGNTAGDGLGQIYLNGPSGNRIDWNINGVASPTLTTRSAGTKLVLYPSVSASLLDYAVGIDSDTMWFSVASSGGSYKWYSNTTVSMQLTGQNLVIGNGAGVGAGRLTVNATAGGTSLYLTDATNATLYVTHTAGGRTSFFNGTGTQWLQEVGTAVTIGASTSAPSKLFLFNTNDGLPDYQITHQSGSATLNTSSPIIITNTYNNGSNGHNLFFTSTAASGIWEYNITKTWGGILTLGSSSTGTSVKRDFYIYDSGQIRFSNYTSTSSFTGTALGVLAFTADGSIITIATPGGGSGITGTGAQNYITKFSNAGATSIGNSQLLDNGTNVSIGTTTLDAKLRVAGPFNGTQAIFGQVDGRGLELATVLVSGTNEAGSILNARGVGSGTLIIQTDGNERVRVASNGDMGLGTNSPTATTNYTTLHVNGSSGGLVRFSYANTNAGYIYGSSAEVGVNAPSVFNLYIASSQKFNVIASEVNAYETFYARKLGAQIQLAGGVGTASGIFQSGDSNVFIADWNTALNGIIVNVNNGILTSRASAVGGAYIQFQRSGSTTYGYVGNSSGLISTAGFNANTDLAIRSEGNINFATSSTAIAQLNTNGRLTLRTYTATNSHTGTIVGFLAFDGSGNIITTAAPSGSSQWTTSSANIYFTGGNVGVGSTNTRLRMEVNATASDWTVPSNDISSGHLLLSHSGGSVMAVGLNTNKAWLQVRDYLGASGGVYDFYLNPTGGRLIVNSETSDGVGALQINGTLSFRNNISVIPAIRFVPKPSLITSTSQGDMETDTNGLLYYSYHNTDRGVIENSHYICLNADFTLTSTTNLQRLFNIGTNGAINVEALLYEFEIDLRMNNLSTTSSSYSLNFAGGTATVSSIRYTVLAKKAVNTPTTPQMSSFNTTGSNAITTSSTTTTSHAVVRGIVRFSTAGTFQARIALGASASAVVQRNSFIKLTPLGGNSYTSIGNIS